MAERAPGEEMTLNIEGIVEGGVCSEEQLGCALGFEVLSCPFSRSADADVRRGLPGATSDAGKRGGGRGLSDG
jgi:hypothetical protein